MGYPCPCPVRPPTNSTKLNKSPAAPAPPRRRSHGQCSTDSSWLQSLVVVCPQALAAAGAARRPVGRPLRREQLVAGAAGAPPKVGRRLAVADLAEDDHVSARLGREEVRKLPRLQVAAVPVPDCQTLAPSPLGVVRRGGAVVAAAPAAAAAGRWCSRGP